MSLKTLPQDLALMSENREQRKRVQNRMNQRAYRRRKAAAESQSPDSKPFRVVRFRLESGAFEPEVENNLSSKTLLRTHSFSPRVVVGNPARLTKKPQEVGIIELPLSSDHLLHLIQHTILRALFTNKDLLRATATFTRADSHVIINKLSSNLCGAYTTILPGNSKIPEHLIPTELQMTRPHSSWIDMFPFKRFRDNLIMYEEHFDHEEMFKDLFGDLVSNFMPSSSCSYVSHLGSGNLASPRVDEVPITANRKGLITWGEPYLTQSWEVTPGFIAKWTWALKGVDELIESSNHWRILRGEDPIRVSFL
ncbi:hypothetical protein BCIN_03g00040 [Botrytis cinerea B05.10]|uniref:BZIP domain-containing protein n=1 Tax=Botryotinia fuckeliana (strain B05.10) TaxID=332648 RepID=A0A384JB45_BOTFB|nr:hypothetical protein BCIN_03g00040 [Botrytis cinerea B05.10]ATZ47692.1 hypothetical protein BCIN_03g00040 [Botrytis cinerea B05.10]